MPPIQSFSNHTRKPKKSKQALTGTGGVGYRYSSKAGRNPHAHVANFIGQHLIDSRPIDFLTDHIRDMGCTAHHRIHAQPFENLDIFRIIYAGNGTRNPEIGSGKLTGNEVILIISCNRNQYIRM